MGNETDNSDHSHNMVADPHTNPFAFHNSRSRRIDFCRKSHTDLCPASHVSCMSDNNDPVYDDAYALRRLELPLTARLAATPARKFSSI
jgi:hypothetical protein